MIKVFIPDFYQTSWEKGYKEGSYIIDCSTLPNPMVATNSIYFRLYKYRKYVRKYKLNPIYTNEWSRLKRCKLRKLSLYTIEIYKCKELIFSRQQEKILFNTPGIL